MLCDNDLEIILNNQNGLEWKFAQRELKSKMARFLNFKFLIVLKLNFNGSQLKKY